MNEQKLGNYCGGCLKTRIDCTCAEEMFKGMKVFRYKDFNTETGNYEPNSDK